MMGKEIVRALRCISTACNATDRNCPECGYFRKWFGCDVDRLSTDAADAIERLTAENAALREKAPQWISVEEQRPEPGKRVLATDGVFVGEAIYALDGRWSGYGGGILRDCLGSVITHWMPLPEAPKFADILRGAPEEGENV